MQLGSSEHVPRRPRDEWGGYPMRVLGWEVLEYRDYLDKARLSRDNLGRCYVPCPIYRSPVHHLKNAMALPSLEWDAGFRGE